MSYAGSYRALLLRRVLQLPLRGRAHGRACVDDEDVYGHLNGGPDHSRGGRGRLLRARGCWSRACWSRRHRRESSLRHQGRGRRRSEGDQRHDHLGRSIPRPSPSKASRTSRARASPRPRTTPLSPNRRPRVIRGPAARCRRGPMPRGAPTEAPLPTPPFERFIPRGPDAAFSATSPPRADGLAKPPRRLPRAEQDSPDD